MRGNILTITLILALLTIPAAAADDDPGYTAPDTTGAEAAAEAAVERQADATTAFTRASWGEASAAANDVQLLEFPQNEATRFLTAAGDFGAAIFDNAGDLANATAVWAAGEVGTKTAETRAVLAAADDVGHAAFGAGQTIVFALLESFCNQPLDVSTPCEPESVGGTGESEVERLIGQSAEDATAEEFDGTRDGLVTLLDGLVVRPQPEQ